MRSLQSKRGQVSNLGSTILLLVFASVVLIFGLVMLQEIRDTDVVKKVNSNTVSNETLTTVNQVGDTVAGASGLGFDSFAVVIVTNATGGETITAANYSATSAGVITIVSGSEYNNTNINISYTYTTGDEAYDAGNETVVGLGNFSDFWEIIVLAIVISIVIGLLLVAFGGSGRR